MRDLEETRPCAEEIGKYRQKLMNFAKRRLHDPAQAEDAVQETLVAAIEGADRFAAGSSLGTWLTGILKHKIVDSVRRHARDKYEPLQEDYLACVSGNPEDSLARRRALRDADRCLDEIPASFAQVLLLRDFLGMSTAEACAAMAIKSNNCSVLLHRARRRFRERLAAAGAGLPA